MIYYAVGWEDHTKRPIRYYILARFDNEIPALRLRRKWATKFWSGYCEHLPICTKHHSESNSHIIWDELDSAYSKMKGVL